MNHFKSILKIFCTICHKRKNEIFFEKNVANYQKIYILMLFLTNSYTEQSTSGLTFFGQLTHTDLPPVLEGELQKPPGV